MAGTPQYGGTGGVAELNIGQPGSARNGSGAASYIVNVLVGADQAVTVNQGVPQQNVTFQDNLGSAPGDVTWNGTLKVNNAATLNAIRSDLDRYKHGSARVAGVLGAPNMSYVRATRLTDSFSQILSENARIVDWSFTDRIRRLHASAFLYITKLRIRFELLR